MTKLKGKIRVDGNGKYSGNTRRVTLGEGRYRTLISVDTSNNEFPVIVSFVRDKAGTYTDEHIANKEPSVKLVLTDWDSLFDLLSDLENAVDLKEAAEESAVASENSVASAAKTFFATIFAGTNSNQIINGKTRAEWEAELDRVSVYSPNAARDVQAIIAQF